MVRKCKVCNINTPAKTKATCSRCIKSKAYEAVKKHNLSLYSPPNKYESKEIHYIDLVTNYNYNKDVFVNPNDEIPSRFIRTPHYTERIYLEDNYIIY